VSGIVMFAYAAFSAQRWPPVVGPPVVAHRDGVEPPGVRAGRARVRGRRHAGGVPHRGVRMPGIGPARL